MFIQGSESRITFIQASRQFVHLSKLKYHIKISRWSLYHFLPLTTRKFWSDMILVTMSSGHFLILHSNDPYCISSLRPYDACQVFSRNWSNDKYGSRPRLFNLSRQIPTRLYIVICLSCRLLNITFFPRLIMPLMT